MCQIEIKRNFNLAKNCIAPLISETQNLSELSELNIIKSVTDNHSSFISFKNSNNLENINHFNHLVAKYADRLAASFTI